MNLVEKIRSMTDEEQVQAVCLGLACLTLNVKNEKQLQAVKPLVDATAGMLREGLEELLLKMPWEKAAWELLRAMTG